MPRHDTHITWAPYEDAHRPGHGIPGKFVVGFYADPPEPPYTMEGCYDPNRDPKSTHGGSVQWLPAASGVYGTDGLTGLMVPLFWGIVGISRPHGIRPGSLAAVWIGGAKFPHLQQLVRVELARGARESRVKRDVINVYRDIYGDLPARDHAPIR
jgi:hypothetical protein